MNLTWDERYAVGVRHLDDDHRDLIALANTLIGTVEQGADVEQARDALENLVELALAHFEAEERVLSECDYPDLREH
nr:hemerythrin [Gammaproteobacteria bacterium]NIR98985.1 hemerythrin [Gammaproteobacteria bacterium]NIV21592.1 hemerythrin [Gammaproteobacteria bacterium]